MTLALRAHHLLCRLTYAGRGYSPDFVRNFDHITARLAAGAPITLVHGPDAICAPLCCGPDGNNAHCHQESARARDAQATRELAPWIGGLPGTGLTLDAALLARLRAAFASGQIRGACDGCEWTELCSRIAADGFTGVRLQIPARTADPAPEERPGCNPHRP